MTAPPAEPVYFGDDNALFGWIHRPAALGSRSTGLVLCNPLGHEALSTHRTYRQCAEAAAAAGIPTLRFDYHGTGDSAGDDTDPDRLQTWIASIRQASRTLRGLFEIDQICLLGIRLGATFAMLAAPESTEIVALIAVNPVVSGRRYLRELRALAATGTADRQVEDGDLQNAAGFVTTASLRAHLEQVDLGTPTHTGLKDVLILDRDDLRPDERFAAALQQQGVGVTRASAPGYAQMMLDSHESIVPAAMLATITQWLLQLDSRAQPTPRSLAATAQPRTTQFVSHGERIRESAVFMDGAQRLFGIVSEPDSAVAFGPILLLLNSGAVHRVGPNRLYVRIARMLAAKGVRVVRLDLAGLGDSPARAGLSDNVVYPPAAVEDIRLAYEFLHNRHGASAIDAAGICSGAYHSFKAGVAGVPLRRLTLINPLTFFWKEGMSLQQRDFQDIAEAQRYRRSGRRWSSWLKLLRGEVDLRLVIAVFSSRARKSLRHGLRDLGRGVGFGFREDLAAELQLLANRGVAIDFVFSASDPGQALLMEQGGRVATRLQRSGAMQITLIDDADHTFTPTATQSVLIDYVGTQYDDLRKSS